MTFYIKCELKTKEVGGMRQEQTVALTNHNQFSRWIHIRLGDSEFVLDGVELVKAIKVCTPDAKYK